MGRSWLFLEGVDPDVGRDHRDHRQEEDELDPYRQPHEPPGPAGPRAASLAVGGARDQLLATVVTRGLDVVHRTEYATSLRSEERRVGKGCGTRRAPAYLE